MSDNELVMYLVERKGYLYRYASTELRNDKLMANTALRTHFAAFRYFPDGFRDDRRMVLNALLWHPNAAEYLFSCTSERLQKDKEVAMKFLACSSLISKTLLDLQNVRDVVQPYEELIKKKKL